MPSFNPVWLTRPYRYSTPPRALFRECVKTPRRTYTTAYIPKVGRPQKPRPTYTHHVLERRPFSGVSGDPHQLRGGGRLHDLTTEAAHEELRRAANAGDYVRVQALVKILVGQRNEQPSPRLYLALLLANTNLQHGSPAEVKRLLLEMKYEGFAPDSSTYHAALKVCWCRKHCELLAYALSTGPCHTS